MDKELNTLATPVPNDELDANETLGSNESTLEEPTAQSEETNPQTEDNIDIEENDNPQTEELKDDYDSIWEQDVDNVDLEQLSNENGEEENGLQEDDNEKENYEENEEEIEEKQEPKNGLVITKPLKYRGKEIWVKTEEEAIELMQKGLDYSFKMNKIKPLRNIASIIEEAGLEPEDVKALADAKNGNEQAIKYLANKFNISIEPEDDIFGDEDRTSDYKPEVTSENPIEEIYKEISVKDPVLAGKVASTWDELDDTFKAELSSPDIFRAFIGSVQTGEFDKVLPEAIKVKAINPALSWIQAYQYAVQNIGSVIQQPKEPTDTVKPKRINKQKRKRKTIEQSYEEIWDNKSIEELEKEIFK